MKSPESPSIVIVTGLGIGEEAKGASVEWLTAKLAAHTILRSGGCQSAHHIETPGGQEQEFTHFGAGTFEGAHTYLKHMVISPPDLFTEALELEKKGVKDPFSLITISDDCLTITPFHGAINRLREILRGKNKKGTVGKGVGEAIRDAKIHPELAIRAGEFKNDEEVLTEKVEQVRLHQLHLAKELIAAFQDELPEAARIELVHLQDKSIVETTVLSFKYLADLVQIVDSKYLDHLIARPGVIINESDHGALLDPKFGFAPHTTEVDPISNDVLETLKLHNYSGEIIRLGVSRCYITRFGAGPLVSYDPAMTAQIREKHNPDNDWLGPFRCGPYDLVAAKYSIAACSRGKAPDGLIISHLDILGKYPQWPVCVGYTFNGQATDLNEYFDTQDGKITGIKLPVPQLRLTELLKQCTPIIINLQSIGDQTLEQVFLKYIEEQLGVPIVVISRGPKTTDKITLPAWDKLFGR